MILTNILVRDIIKCFNPSSSELHFSIDDSEIIYGIYARTINYIVPNSLCQNPRQDLSVDLVGRRIDIRIKSLFNCLISPEVAKDKVFMNNYNISNGSNDTLKSVDYSLKMLSCQL